MHPFIEGIAKKFKQFKPTSWSVDNRTAIYIITILISLYGLNKFNTLPKEQFPDIVVPTISVSTVYFGTSPKDMENLVTRPIEKQLKGISGAKVKKIQSTSQQDFSLIIIEFDTDVKTEVAKQKVKDAIDKAQTDLPTDLTQLPNVQEFDFSEMPIMYVNVSGDYDGMTLKKYADNMQDHFEELTEISRADIVGAPEREIQINVDPFKMQAAKLSFNDISNAISYENRDISGGLIEVGEMKRTIRVKGQFNSALDMRNIVVKNLQAAPIYLRDVAEIIDTVKETESYARLDGKNVVTLNIIKRSGENLINAADKIKAIVDEMREKKELPPNLKIVITGDQSIKTKISFNDLVNTIIIGFILVLVVLMFFMGVTNAFFVALSVPLSVFVAFLFLPLADSIVGTHVTLNFIVLFALLFGLGIIVDDAIVVIENTHRIYNNGKVRIERAAKEAAGEVFIPVLAGTLTTLAPFFPLLLWKGIIGKFMIYLPTMLILTLAASLIVAFIINPVFAVSFMHPDGREFDKPKKQIFRQPLFWVLIAFGILCNLAGWHGFGNFLLVVAALMLLNRFVLRDMIHTFQEKVLPGLMNSYEKMLHWVLKGARPARLMLWLFLLFPIALGLLILRNNPKPFFPSGDPNFVYVYLKMPIGTKTSATDSVTRILEQRVQKVLGKELPGNEGGIVESVITNVAVSANNPRDNNRSTQSNLGRIQISFVEYEKRDGKSTAPLMAAIREQMTGIPGATIEVKQEDAGPPTDPPVNIEVSGDNFDEIAKVAYDLQNHLDTNRIHGIEGLRMDVDLQNPEVTINIDRERALREGISTAQIGMEIRSAVFGKEASKLKDGEDEYKIQIRYNQLQRNNISDLMNMRLTFRDMSTMGIKQVPLNAVATVEYTNTSGGVKRKNVKRTIQIQSNITDPSLTGPINAELAKKIEEFKDKTRIPSDVTIKQTGEGEQQAETMSFLGTSLLSALLLIFLILVLQFNSLSKPFIVLTEIFFSIIGVLIGYAVTGMSMATIMVGVGIIGLAGIVIKNGILLIEFTDELRGRGYKTRAAAIEAGKIRIIPVLLTALATMLGLLPLAVGFNIDFVSLFTHFNPHIFFGGDSVVFWGPLSWTIIFGLIFAFFLTLVMVPSMYLISERLRRPMEKFYGTKYVALLGFTGPFFFITVGIMFLVRRIQGKKVWLGKMKDSPAI
ncbi:MAG: efflux RND transporter permease subunit [Chitinophagaceae bacterium]|nr:efflux RND transporter permease subunit [Chitinophagaceae bacterium]MCA6455536.1 efflux RND transporter permease subunit [Chitinophagaceae bacterium]MCA6459170.1 efflux RND transporter permease subunit [Chitinophagaceae bacterium]MCA6465700.1 efflux RND transporter permease subunit [Chitinophagaceae bacterium]MEA3425751.1 efflux RND transporter permease subunit [Bacteroidota bacterium]